MQYGEGTANVKFKPDDPNDGKKRIRIRVGVFFDGTLNNRTNIDQRLLAKLDPEKPEKSLLQSLFGKDADGAAAVDKNPLTAEERAWAEQLKRENSSNYEEAVKKARKTYKKYGDPGNDNSYEGYYTNVVKMHRHLADKTPGYGLTLKTYIEGSGTIDKDGDARAGFALAMGPSGVPKKVAAGVRKAVNLVTENHTDRGVVIELLTLDVFGFSRGAAGARNFINDALFGHNKDYSSSIRAQLEAKGYTIDSPSHKTGVKVCFAGLYDTVSTYGLGVTRDKDDNVEALSLNAVFHAEETLHLTAADEHRYHFSLTGTRSAGKRGRQIFLPGVHSDIGGGYRDSADEAQPILGSTALFDQLILEGCNPSVQDIENDKKQLVAAGWYKESPIEHENEITIENHDYTYFPEDGTDPVTIERRVLSVKRQSIHNNYSRIPLQIMVKGARAKGVTFKGAVDRDEAVPSELSDAQQRIQHYIGEQGRYSSKADHWHRNESWLRNLRHRYFHFSARMSAGHDPRIVNGKRTRKIYNNG